MSLHPTCLIVDDEALLRARLARQLRVVWPELNIVGEAGDGDSALQSIHAERPDIVFLDIRMPAPDGLEVAKQLVDAGHACHIVFVTAYDEHALEAFERAAVDYLLKPLSEKRLVTCVNRLKQRVGGGYADLASLIKQLQNTTQPRYRQWLKVSQGEEVRLLSVDEVDYLQAADKYTSVYVSGKQWLLRASLKTLEDELDPQHYWRIHRGIIVRVSAIKRATRDLAGRWSVEVEGYTHHLQVSRAHGYLFKTE